VVKIAKNSLKECVFVNLALKMNTLLQTALLAILPTRIQGALYKIIKIIIVKIVLGHPGMLIIVP